jgi:uncharacterized protein
MCRRILLLLVITSLTLRAADTVPSESSIKELLATTQVQKMLDQMLPQMDAMMQRAMAEALKGQTITPDAQKMIDQSRANALAVMKEELAWSKLEPLYIRVYQKSLTQEEVTGMVALYKTPAGQAMINKMPLVMQNTMAEMQTMMAPMMQRLQQSQQQLVAQIKQQAPPKG